MTIEQVKEEAKKRFGFPSELTEAILKGYSAGELSAQELEDVIGGLHYELDVINNGTQPGTINIYNTEELSPQELEEVRGGSDLKLRRPFPKDFLAKLEPYVPDGPLKEWMTAHGSEELSEEELDNVAGGVFSKRLLPPIIEIPPEKQPKWLRKMLD